MTYDAPSGRGFVCATTSCTPLGSQRRAPRGSRAICSGAGALSMSRPMSSTIPSAVRRRLSHARGSRSSSLRALWSGHFGSSCGGAGPTRSRPATCSSHIAFGQNESTPSAMQMAGASVRVIWTFVISR